jgi:tRNA-Thr(GGU) m(6)t(6)A37 methyltransferase TsaA
VRTGPPAGFELRPIGVVGSPLAELEEAPRQGDEGAPDAWLVLDPSLAGGLAGLTVGDEVVVVSWLHHADRTVLRTHPRGDTSRPEAGVFATRAPDRPNPIGLHEVTVLAIEEHRVQVSRMEAVDGTPVLDIKPVLRGLDAR